MLRWLLFGALVVACQCRLLLEIEFDIAAVQEEQPGQQVGHILTTFIHDPNVLWLRHLNTLADGSDGHTPTRMAFIEFNSSSAWIQFEQTQKSAGHVLFDIYWVNWRRVPWMSNKQAPFKSTADRTPKEEGYILMVKYTVHQDKKDRLKQLEAQWLQATVNGLAKTDSFLQRSSYDDAKFTPVDSHLVMYEFTNIVALGEALYAETAPIFETRSEVRQCFSRYAATMFQPAYDGEGSILTKTQDEDPEL